MDINSPCGCGHTMFMHKPVQNGGRGKCDSTNCPCPTFTTPDPKFDSVNHPRHYKSHPSGIECIEVTRHMGFNLGNAVKHIWRCDEKKDAIEDLKKAAWYIADEIEKRTKVANGS